MQIKSFKATNYGPLEDLELHFSSDMNNISLPHGAGTTTILKTMYSIVESTRETTIEGKRRLLNEKLISVFPITTHSIGKLISQVQHMSSHGIYLAPTETCHRAALK